MKTKQLIERNLKFDQKYIYIELTKGSVLDGQCTICDNCGHLISNIVTVVNKGTKKRYYIGTDCAETLSGAKCLFNNGYETDFYTDIYSYNKAAKVATELSKGKVYINDGLYIRVYNDKGKQIDSSVFDMNKYFPELL